MKYRTKTDLRQILYSYWPKNFDNVLIRAGSDGDGGYLIPDITVDILFSAGVEKNIDFELDVTNRYGCPVYMLDRSVDRLPADHKNFTFERLWLGNRCDQETVSINKWIRKYNKNDSRNSAFKVDIEGSEYEVFDFLEEDLQNNFVWIVCEFHSFENILSYDDLVSKTLSKILKTHDIFHIHPNNLRKPFRKYGYVIPSDIEFTFLRKDLFEKKTGYSQLPRRQDCDNTNNYPIELNWVRDSYD